MKVKRCCSSIVDTASDEIDVLLMYLSCAIVVLILHG
jgi:hypothetical protein